MNRVLLIFMLAYLGACSSESDSDTPDERFPIVDPENPTEDGGSEDTSGESGSEFVIATSKEEFRKIISQEPLPQKTKLAFSDASDLYLEIIKDIDPSFNKLDVSKWDVSEVTIMTRMFAGAADFNQPIGDWNTANVTDMNGMFNGATSFNQPIGKWNTSNVTDMRYMFYSASSFNQNIENWDTAKVTRMNRMFTGSGMADENIPSWYP